MTMEKLEMSFKCYDAEINMELPGDSTIETVVSAITGALCALSWDPATIRKGYDKMAERLNSSEYGDD